MRIYILHKQHSFGNQYGIKTQLLAYLLAPLCSLFVLFLLSTSILQEICVYDRCARASRLDITKILRLTKNQEILILLQCNLIDRLHCRSPPCSSAAHWVWKCSEKTWVLPVQDHDNTKWTIYKNYYNDVLMLLLNYYYQTIQTTILCWKINVVLRSWMNYCFFILNEVH